MSLKLPVRLWLPKSCLAAVNPQQRCGWARARSAEDTRRRVLDAAVRRLGSRLRSDIRLDAVPGERRAVLVDALVCACDVYTWKLLRRDMGRSRAEAEATMTVMIESLLAWG